MPKGNRLHKWHAMILGL